MKGLTSMVNRIREWGYRLTERSSGPHVDADNDPKLRAMEIQHNALKERVESYERVLQAEQQLRKTQRHDL